MYNTPIKDLAELRLKITEHCQLIEPESLKSVFLNIEKRLHLVIENGGAHIEQLLNIIVKQNFNYLSLI